MDNHKRSYASNDNSNSNYNNDDNGDLNDMHDFHKSKSFKKSHEKNDDDDDNYNLKLSKHNKIDHQIIIEDRNKKDERSDNDFSSSNGTNSIIVLLSLFICL